MAWAWSEDFQVEQDLIIRRYFPGSGRRTGPQGGTALYKLYLTPPARYSEDIVWFKSGPAPPVR